MLYLYSSFQIFSAYQNECTYSYCSGFKYVDKIFGEHNDNIAPFYTLLFFYYSIYGLHIRLKPIINSKVSKYIRMSKSKISNKLCTLSNNYSRLSYFKKFFDEKCKLNQNKDLKDNKISHLIKKNKYYYTKLFIYMIPAFLVLYTFCIETEITIDKILSLSFMVWSFALSGWFDV